MNREQKGAAIAEIAADIEASEAVFAVDYRGMSVAQAAELRAKLRDADASFKVVKNSLTERAADVAGAEALKELLVGPTALAFVRGDAALAAKAIADYARATSLLPFKGGLMGSEALAAEDVSAISRLPSRDVLYGQLVGIVASPVSGLVRTLGALIGGLAVALGQVREKKEAGEIPAGAAPAPSAGEADASPQEPESAGGADASPEQPESPREADASSEGPKAADAEGGDEAPSDGESAAPGSEQLDDNVADPSAEADAADATKED